MTSSSASSSGGLPSVYTLTSGPDTVTTTSGHAIFVATDGTLSTGDSITLAGHGNELLLSGPGSFDLTAPTTLSGVDTVVGDHTAAQTITLPSAALTLFTGNGNNTITSLLGNDRIFLGSGTDSVTTGAGTTTVHTGSGADTVTATGAGALTVTAGTGTTQISFGGDGGVVRVEHGTGTISVSGLTASTAHVDVAGLGIGSYSALQSGSTIGTDGHGGTQIAITGGPTIDLLGITSVTASDFTFSSSSHGGDTLL